MSVEDEQPSGQSPDEPTAPTPEPASEPTEKAKKKAAAKKKKDKKLSVWEVYFPRRVHEDKEAIPVASFPMIFFFWPCVLVFGACALFQGLGWIENTTAGWWVIGTLAFNLVVIVHDLDQKKFMILALSLVVGALAVWITSLKGLGFLAGTTAWLRNLEPTLSNDALFLMASLFGFFFLVGLFQPRFNYWRIEPNEFVHYIQPWGRDQSIPRQGSTVTREIPDILELMLTFGGGTLVVRREGQVIARIEHVPFLGRRMIAIERMLGATRVRHVEE